MTTPRLASGARVENQCLMMPLSVVADSRPCGRGRAIRMLGRARTVGASLQAQISRPVFGSGIGHHSATAAKAVAGEGERGAKGIAHDILPSRRTRTADLLFRQDDRIPADGAIFHRREIRRSSCRTKGARGSP